MLKDSLAADLYPRLFSTCTTTGPLDLAAELAAAGMQAASWQVEALAEEHADITQSFETVTTNFEDAVVQADAIASKADDIDTALLAATNGAEDADAEDPAAALRALLEALDGIRSTVQSLAMDAKAISEIDNSPQAMPAGHWKTEAPKTTKRRRKAA